MTVADLAVCPAVKVMEAVPAGVPVVGLPWAQTLKVNVALSGLWMTFGIVLLMVRETALRATRSVVAEAVEDAAVAALPEPVRTAVSLSAPSELTRGRSRYTVLLKVMDPLVVTEPEFQTTGPVTCASAV